MGIPVPKTLVIWASSSHITLTIQVRVTVTVMVTGDARITRVWKWGCSNRGNAHTTVTPLLTVAFNLVPRAPPEDKAVSMVVSLYIAQVENILRNLY